MRRKEGRKEGEREEVQEVLKGVPHPTFALWNRSFQASVTPLPAIADSGDAVSVSVSVPVPVPVRAANTTPYTKITHKGDKERQDRMRQDMVM